MKRTKEIIVEVVAPAHNEDWLYKINHELEQPFYPFFYESSWLETNASVNETIQRYCWSFSSDQLHEISLLKENLLALCPKHYRQIEREFEDSLWSQPWQENFSHLETRLFRIQELSNQELQIVKSPELKDRKTLIHLLPSSSFGRGDHASTEAILKLIEDCKDEIASCRIGLDIGSGNGVLCFASIHLGVKKMYATEMDDDAFQALNQNIKINDMEQSILAFHTQQVNVVSGFDLLLINVLSGSLLPLLEHALSNRDSGRITRIFLAGFNEQEAPSIQAFMKNKKAELTHSLCVRGWSALKFNI